MKIQINVKTIAGTTIGSTNRTRYTYLIRAPRILKRTTDAIIVGSMRTTYATRKKIIFPSAEWNWGSLNTRLKFSKPTNTSSGFLLVQVKNDLYKPSRVGTQSNITLLATAKKTKARPIQFSGFRSRFFALSGFSSGSKSRTKISIFRRRVMGTPDLVWRPLLL